METINIILNKEMMIKELYRLRSFIEPENDEAKKAIMEIIDLVNNAPSDKSKSSYPKIRAR